MAILDLSRALRAIAGLHDAPATETRWLALTGAPVAGKSSILHVLEGRGHRVRKEQARAYMEKQIATGKTLKEIAAHPALLSREIFRRNAAAVGSTPVNERVVFDRSLPDVLAFSLIDGVDVEPFVEECARRRFAVALVFEQIPTADDALRYHTPTQIAEVVRMCEALYGALGARVQRVPPLPDAGDEWLAQKAALVERELGGIP